MPDEEDLVERSLQIEPSAVTKDACQECRLNKVKCSFPSPRLSRCARCAKYDFQCSVVVGKKRGRKARSKVAALEASKSPSAVTRQTAGNRRAARAREQQRSEPPSPRTACPLLADPALRKRAWQIVAQMPATRGSTYNFVSAGDADVSAARGQAASVSTSASSRSSASRSGRTTLRSLLQPLLHPGSQDKLASTSTPELPRVIKFDRSGRDPRGMCRITQTRCDELIDYFMDHLQPWIAVVSFNHNDLHICPLLYTAICYQASKYSNGPVSETISLASHCRALCILAFAEIQDSVANVLAFYLLSVWKTADDYFTDWYMSFADQVARHRMANEDNPGRHGRRIQYFHYVQRHVFLLHHGSSSNYDRDLPGGAQGPQELTKQLVEWCHASDALCGDWFLCADVESTSIQCRYAIAFTERYDRRSNTGGAYSIAETVSSKSLLDEFVQEMVNWEERWSCEARRVSGRDVGQGEPIEHTVGFGLFKNSVRGHVASYALKDALKVWLQERRSHNRSSLSSATRSSTEEYLNAAYLLCLEGMLGVLQQFTLFRDEDPRALLHAPDSLVILADHAALMMIYLLLLPGVLAELSTIRSADRIRQDATSPHIASMVSTAETCAQECIDTLQEAMEQMRRASIEISSAPTAVHLSARYLADLLELARRSSSTRDQGADANGDTNDSTLAVPPSGNAINDVGSDTAQPDLEPNTINDAELFNDWLQSFLRDFSSDAQGASGSNGMDFPMPSFM